MKYLLIFLQALLLFLLCSCKSHAPKLRELNFELRDMFGNKATIWTSSMTKAALHILPCAKIYGKSKKVVTFLLFLRYRGLSVRGRF